jgi:erythronate-4-phosphate dehydrogenase
MSSDLHFVIDKDIPFIRGVLEPFGQVTYLAGLTIQNENIRDADALIIRTRTKCNERLLRNSRVKIIASATIGMDHIDTDYCEQSGIKYQNAPGCNSGSVMQYIASALVNLALHYDFDLKDKILGVIGHGNVGSKVARMARTLGMEVLVNDPPLARKEEGNGYCHLQEIQKNADIISLHVPLNRTGRDKTLKLVNRSFMEGLKKKPILINSSRGEVIDEKDLKTVLKRKQIKDVVLDVWHNEPAIDPELLQIAGIATPHIAGYSADGKANGTSTCIQAISSFFQLGLGKWRTPNVPLPAGTKLQSSSFNGGYSKVFQAILHSYDIMKDDKALRNDPARFEKLRADYPLRREFHAYQIASSGLLENESESLKSMGFTINPR